MPTRGDSGSVAKPRQHPGHVIADLLGVLLHVRENEIHGVANRLQIG